MENLHKRIFITVFGALFIALPIIAFVFLPEGEGNLPPFSENENRYLNKYVSPNAKNVFQKEKNRRFATYFDDWFSDRFAFREDFIVLKNELELAQGKTEINGVFTVQDRLIEAWRDYDEQAVNSVLTAMGAFAERNPDLSISFMLVPTSQEIYGALLPANSEVGNQELFIRNCYNSLENIAGIDVLAPLVEAEKAGDYIYYRTDHHWTSRGAYIGYYAACSKLGLIPYEAGWFAVEDVSSDFRGTLYSKTLNRKITPDVISFYKPARTPPSEVTLTINTGLEVDEYSSLYFTEYLKVKDKYSAFLGTNAPIMDITTNLENNEKSLLIFKDSYAHALIPFLVNHYKRITVLDMRYINVDIREYVNLEDYGQVLFLYNAITFSGENDLVKLNLAK